MKKRTNFYMMSRNVFKIGLTAIQICVLSYLVSCVNNEGKCYPSFSTIASACNIAKNTVQSAIKSLIKKKLITKENTYHKMPSGKMRKANNTYTILDLDLVYQELVADMAMKTPDLCQALPLGVSADGEEINKQKELNNFNNNDHSFNKENPVDNLNEILEKLELEYYINDFYMRETFESIISQMYFSEYISVDNAKIPQEIIRKHLSRLHGEIVEYAYKKMRANTAEFSKGSKYMMACLYNAINEFDLQTDIDVARDSI